MNNSTKIIVFIILLGTLVVTAYALPCDLSVQAALPDILNKMRDLGISLISVEFIGRSSMNTLQIELSRGATRFSI